MNERDVDKAFLLATEDYSPLYELFGELAALETGDEESIIARGREVIKWMATEHFVEVVRWDEMSGDIIKPVRPDQLDELLADPRNWDVPSRDKSSVRFSITERGYEAYRVRSRGQENP